MPTEILIEGFTEDEILALPAGEIRAMVLTGEPVVFRAGSATILGRFEQSGSALAVELAHVDGGGEGVLISIYALARRWAQLAALERIEWTVHAVHCARPNPKLRPVLERRGFVVSTVDGVEAYRMSEALN